MGASKEDIIANLRAIIISSKGGLRLSDVKADYRETFGEDIPLKDLGYNSLDQFFKSNPDNFNLKGSCVTAVVKSSSCHISSLVSRQQGPKRKTRSRLPNKTAGNLRKPRKTTITTKTPSTTTSASGARKYNYEIPPRFVKQESPPSLMAIHWTQVEAKALLTHEDVPTPEKPRNSSNSEKSKASLTQEEVSKPERRGKNSKSEKSKGEMDFKTFKEAPRMGKSNFGRNNESENALRSPVESPVSPVKEEVVFEDFEDLNISEKTQSRLLKVNLDRKNVRTIGTPNGKVVGTSSEMPAASNSPFRRSLAQSSHQEILSAKKSAQVSLENNNIDPSKRESSLTVFDVGPEEDAIYEHKLKQFCMDKGLIMPVYSVIVRETKNHANCYGCKLTIGDFFQVSTYPVETHSEITARELASKKAYNQLCLNRNFPSPFYETENVVKLVEMCLKKNLPSPIFKSIECHPKNEPNYFICKVRIGDGILLSSYPAEAQDETTARDIAAKKALEHLMSDQKSSSGISKGDSVLTQIFNVIKTKEYGVWSNKLPALYMETYNEELPPNWFDLVAKSLKFEISSVDKVGHIIRASSQSDEPVEQPVLATLKVPESNQWEVYITNVVTSAEIWCRLIGKEYNEAYDTMMTKLELQPPTVTVKTPGVGEIYLVNLEHTWNRVKITEVYPEKKEVGAFLIDIGVEEIIKISQLFQLDKDFFSIAPQAIMLSLHELDSLAECEELQSALFRTLLGNVFIAEVIAILDEGGNVSSVVLWDTSTDEDINVNSKLLGNVIQTIKSPMLPAVGLIKEMYVSHVEDNGDVYVQQNKQIVHFVNCIISTRMKNCAKLVPAVSSKLDPKKLYITRCQRNGLFYRVRVWNTLEPNFVTVKFIDYGLEQRSRIDDLFDLEATAIDLATIPSQAIRVKLSNLKNFKEKILNKLREWIIEQNVLIKVIKASPGFPPYVEVFKRSPLDGTLSSINNKINNEEDLQMASVPIRKKSYVIGLESTLSKHLPMPNIPPVGSYFNVFVTLAANPDLFNVQPLSTQSELMELMFRLQEKCEATFSKPLAPEEFKIGELYAVKHADDFWYRAYAHAVVSPSAYTVCLSDFGDFIIVPAEKLMHLPSEFKTFPYQAIRAYLAGVAPVNKDWSAVDCVEFRELVIEKQFVSQVVEINRDLKNPNYISLGLILVDTSSNEDVYIHQLLVNKKKAVFKK